MVHASLANVASPLAGNGLEGILNDLEDYRKLEKGETDGILRDKDTIGKSAVNAQANIERIKADLAKAREKSAKAMKSAEDLITDDLYDAYADDEDFAQAIATWFQANGFADATAENCEAYTRYIGSRSKKNGSKASAKSGILQTAQNKKSFTTIWLGALADDFQNAGIINAYKYTFDVTKKK